ncbi:Peripla_BP_6 domain-containing protein [Rubrivivax sp. A210]|uniref:ABC transporter substrate-binding protein n=1 Tax=Rubrivivax sp. A210 TaxID=2772301 RepID=UPI001919D1E3|nr:ABC transporter substrate-binding protein [Rubrivivax sp. A210]CAD5366825.1 Peripla_BP_6 domain-containing protein [Rubrivivax sp. A210]
MKRRGLLQGAGAALALASGVVRASPRLRIGVPLPFTGVQSEVANDLRAGYEMAFAHASEAGLNLEPVWADDEAKADQTARLVEQFARDRSILATTGIVGTPHAKAAVPRAVVGGLPVVGLRSGAVELRDGTRGVYHLRASYTDELTRMVRTIGGASLNRLAVVYSNDAFGTAAAAHVAGIVAEHGVTVVSNEPAERGGSDIQAAVSKALDPSKHAKALLLLVLEGPMLKGVTHARTKMSFLAPVFCMSFCATRRLAEATDPNLVGLGLVSAFPLPRTDLSPLADHFRKVAVDWSRPGVIHSLTAFEGYLYGSVLASAIRRAPDTSRAGLVAALNAPQEVGGIRVAFDSKLVGYHYLQLIYKSGTGVLRA